ncbi:MAG: tyrosine-type recombinase/integrase [Anaerolineae bacterium]|nr:tyrosine-type recombinase/integrase [Anaerolineae bacterium]
MTEIVVATHQDLLAAWADFLRLDVAAGDASPQTLATYQAQVRDFLAWCEAQGIHPALATEDDLKAYRAHLAERYARATVATRLAAVRRFYQAAVWRGFRPDNPAEGLKPPRERTAREERVRFLSLEGLKRLLDAPDRNRRGNGLRALRDRAILALMGVHGLRVGEVVRLNVADLDLEAGTLAITGKGEKRRTVYLVDISRERLAEWLAVRERAAAEEETALFVALDRAGRWKGRRMTRRAVEALTDRYLSALGLKRAGISCHSLRHSAAVWARAFGATVDALADMLGHSSVDTTRVYAKIVRKMEENPARFLEAALGE